MLAAIVLCQMALLRFVISESNCSQAIQNKIIGKRMPSNWPRVEKNIGFQMCLRKCEAISYCLSINFNRVLFECELNDRRKNDTNDLVDGDNYFYAETVRMDHFGNVCGQETCNNYSSCISLSGNRKVCLETDCSESAPVVPNGKIVERTYFPASITYGCNPDSVSNGSLKTITCPPGGKWSTLDFRCEKHYTRLVGSNFSYEGRVEVYRYGSWGTVCEDDFDLSDADVVCRSLGYPGALQVRSALEFGGGSGEIWMDKVDCLQNERKILDCAHNTEHNCDHSEDVGVVCIH